MFTQSRLQFHLLARRIFGQDRRRGERVRQPVVEALLLDAAAFDAGRGESNDRGGFGFLGELAFAHAPH